jgi:glycolate oxidase iron-sulfur subunit
MSVPTADSPASRHPVATGVEYQRFLDCVHCGLCLSACPTFVELGTEMDSPRGRIYLMRAVTDGRSELDATARRHLDLCLDCRACESACPSGVRYGEIIEPFRVHMGKAGATGQLSAFQRLALFHVFPYPRRARAALAPVRGLHRLGLGRLVRMLARHLPRRLRAMYEMLPTLGAAPARIGEFLPAQGPRRARVALFTGCVADAVFSETTLATARVLQRNGCDVWVPRGQGCCGAIHYHAGAEEPAHLFARANVAALAAGEGVDAIVVNAAGCGAMLKDYGRLLLDTHEEQAGQRLAGKVRDISEFLIQLGPLAPEHALPIRATYHDACHLCHAQQIREQPRRLLGMIPGLELVPLAESELCCGAAGTYSVCEPEMADRLGQRKVDHILKTGARAVFAGNVGCLLQIGRHLRERRANVWAAHPVDALWASYSGEMPALLRAAQATARLR